jgi:hypothetical protein
MNRILEVAGIIFIAILSSILVIMIAYGQMIESPFVATSTSSLNISAPSNESSAASWASNSPLTTTQDSDEIGQGPPLLDPFETEVIQEDGDNDGSSTCNDPILQISVHCPVGWELDEEEDSISFNVADDFYTYNILERQHIFPNR